ncbi:DNA repair protein RecN (Recombination protein N) [Zhouia amylolytica]|uniref:DNA repair protein RecN n=1 Tax=Zhouia amylolytica TaxID=376730 RepID=A0A1I6QXI5_9FLAO|nr:DNA repair protein RecN [Zhouia amylolytica]SFS57112.1 DNA repair protein RecN (Recombination protein N) [Zhouia amylolytica]
MLRSLSITNYALIDALQVEFDNGLNIITGETGAGKSILLGGLSLVLGSRADLSTIKDKNRKCIIEAVFEISAYNLQEFFNSEDLDYESVSIIRREILPSGKSRAFINDTPVTLSVLSSLGSKLVDIHSQHQTLQLTDNTYQFKILDLVAGSEDVLADYKKVLLNYYQEKKELEKLIDFQKKSNKEHDYNSFLLNELKEANLKEGMLEELEATYEELNNVEEIGEKLVFSIQLLNEDQIGVVNTLANLKATLNKLVSYGKQYEDLHNRINSILIDLNDASDEITNLQESLDANPILLGNVSEQLQKIYDLQKKHGVLEIGELLKIQEQLESTVFKTENLDVEIKEAQLSVLKLEEDLDHLAQQLHEKRVKVIPELIQYLEITLGELGMQNAEFKINLRAINSYLPNGKEDMEFLFSANKGTSFEELKKVASGGELSRIMLTIKSLLAKHTKLPTIMFDEIDTGVSGEVSNKMGDIMQKMSETMQVFTITHLPQVAAKGNVHYKVYKKDEEDTTTTNLKRLSEEERVFEIAEMLGGKDVSTSALQHAKQLLN